MIESGYELIAVFTAWLIGLCFVRVEMRRAVLFSAAAGLVCAVGSYVVRTLDVWAWIEPIWLIVFLIATLLAKALFKIRWDEALLALMLALGAFLILLIPWCMFWVSSTDIGRYAPWLGLGCVVLFDGMLLLLYKRFPEKDWQSAFKKLCISPRYCCSALTAVCFCAYAGIRIKMSTVSQ